MLVHAAHGESQYKLQSARNALDATPGCRFKVQEGQPLSNGNSVSLLSKQTQGERFLVQFAWDVNTFGATRATHGNPAFTLSLASPQRPDQQKKEQSDPADPAT